MLIVIATLSLPFIVKKPIDLPPIISVELIQIGDLTNIPFAPKAKKIIEKVKKEKEKLVSEQAPPKKVKKEKKLKKKNKILKKLMMKLSKFLNLKKMKCLIQVR